MALDLLAVPVKVWPLSVFPIRGVHLALSPIGRTDVALCACAKESVSGGLGECLAQVVLHTGTVLSAQGLQGHSQVSECTLHMDSLLNHECMLELVLYLRHSCVHFTLLCIGLELQCNFNSFFLSNITKSGLISFDRTIVHILHSIHSNEAGNIGSITSVLYRPICYEKLI